MKYCILIIISLLLIGSSASSQDGNIGFSLSYDRIIYPFIGYPEHKNNGSYMVGGHISYNLSSRVAFKTGILYESKDFIIDYQGAGWVITEENFQLEYLVFPIKMEFDLIISMPNILSFNASFELGKLLSGKRIIEYETGTITEMNSGYQFNELVTNLTLGLNYKYFVLPNFFIGIQPSTRFNLTDSQGIQGNTGGGTGLSFGFRIAIGYKLNLLKNHYSQR